jgi:PKD repeat protein
MDPLPPALVRGKFPRRKLLLPITLTALLLVVAQVVLAAPPMNVSFTASNPTPNDQVLDLSFAASATDDDSDITAYEWDFDYDGAFTVDATGQNPTHIFPDPGSYSVALRVVDGTVNDGAVDTSNPVVQSVTVTRPNTNPSATNIVFAPQPPLNGNRPHVGQTIAFSGSGTDADGDPITFEWNFGDGGTATGQDVTHAYATRGAKTVTLTVRDNRGGTGTRQATVTVNELPVADAHILNAQAEPGQRIDTPLAGQAYAFTSGPVPGVASSGSMDAEGALSFAWDLDNNGTFETAGENAAAATPALQTAGQKTVRLRVTDSDQATNVEALTYRVNSAPIPGFIFDPPTPAVNKPVQFSSTSSDPDGSADPLTYAWDIDGDGTFGEAFEQGPNPSHAFTTPGTKAVRLRVTDTGGISRTLARNVMVQLSVPNGDFRFSPASPLPGQAVTFESTSTPSEPGKQITGVEWDFAYDAATGTFTPDASGNSVSHAFGSPGPKTVAIRVTEGPAGGFDIAPATVVVNAPPNANFSMSDENPTAGVPVTLSSTSADPDGPLASQQWDLDGDGQFDDASSPVVFATFSRPGSYTLRLRVTDSKGAAATAVKNVTVRSPPKPVPTLLQGVLIEIKGSLHGRKTRVQRLLVKAPRGSKVTVRCFGRSCPKASRKASKAVKGRQLRFKKLERMMRPRTRIVVRVTKPGFIGRVTTFKMRARQAPQRTDLCLTPGAKAASSCPS